MKKINKKWLLIPLTLWFFYSFYFNERYPFSIKTLQVGFKTLRFYVCLAYSLTIAYLFLFLGTSKFGLKLRASAFANRVAAIFISVMFLGFVTMSIIMGDEKDFWFYMSCVIGIISLFFGVCSFLGYDITLKKYLKKEIISNGGNGDNDKVNQKAITRYKNPKSKV